MFSQETPSSKLSDPHSADSKHEVITRNTDHITAREFQNFRQDVGREFKEVHECTERIEDKLDDFQRVLDDKLDPILNEFQHRQEKQKRQWDLKMTIFGIAIGAGFSVATAVVIYILGIGG